MKKVLSMLLALCMLMSMTTFASAEGGTIMWLSNTSSGIQYESTRDYMHRPSVTPWATSSPSSTAICSTTLQAT